MCATSELPKSLIVHVLVKKKNSMLLLLIAMPLSSIAVAFLMNVSIIHGVSVIQGFTKILLVTFLTN